jgi:hypothetical protein
VLKRKKVKKYLGIIAAVNLLLNPIIPVVQSVKAAETGEVLSTNINITEYTNEYIRGYVNQPQNIERIIANVTTPNGTIKQLSNYNINRVTGEFKLYLESQPNGSTVQLLIVYVTGDGYEVAQGPSITLDKKEEKQPSVPAVRPINEQSVTIAGYSEPHALVKVWKNDQLLAEGTANQQGQFTIPIEKQAVGTVLSVSATNKNGSSEKVNITVKEEAAQKTIPLEVDPINEEGKDIFIRTEANTTIEVRKNYEIIDIIEPDEHTDAQYWATYRYLDKDDEIFIRSYDNQGNSSEYVIQKVRDNIRPYLLNLKKVTDATGELHVLSEPGAKIEISQNGKLLGQGTANEIGLFDYTFHPIPAALERIMVRAIDEAGNISEMELVIVDVTSPAIPVLEELVYTTSTRIKGKAEPWSKVGIKKNGSLYKTVEVYQDGTFQLDINGLEINDELEFIATDKAGHNSETLLVKVTEPPTPTAPIVNTVTNLSAQITGTAESNAVLELYKEGQLLKTVTANNNGSFVFDIISQKEGTELIVLAVKHGKVSQPTKIVVKDVKAPEILSVNEVNDRDIKVTGTTEPNAKIEVMANEIVIGTGMSDAAGSFIISIPVQKAGTSIRVTATDLAGNKSQAAMITVKDKTPPVIVSVDPVTDNTQIIKGQTEPGATVNFYTDGVYKGQIKADGLGVFLFHIGYLKANTKLDLYAADAAGNISKSIQVTVKDATPPAQPQVNTVTNKSKEISGKTEANATVTVTIGGKAYSAKADGYGNYKITIPVQNTGTSISVTAKDSAWNVSAVRTTTVVRAAPNMPTVNTVNNKATAVTGKTEANAIVTVTIGGKAYSAKADGYGNYKVTIPVQNTGTSISVTAKDSAGNVSAVRTTTVVRAAPNMPTVNTVRYYSTTVTGKTEKYAIVAVKIGTKIYTAKANAYGDYKVYIPKQRAGTKLYVNAKDSKGQVSATRIVTVAK